MAHAQGVATSSWSVRSSVFVGAGDFNGDGLPDFLLGSKTDSTAWNGKIAYSNGPQPDFLTAVRYPMGGVTTIAYHSFSASNGTNAAALKAPTSRLPFVMQTVASVTADDGLGLASSKATTRFAYAGGKWDAKERRFLGFKTVTVTHPCNTGETACPKTVITARQDLAAARAPEHIEEQDGSGTVLRSLARTWSSNNAAAPFTALVTGEAQTEHAGGATKTARVSYSYDSYGNLTQRTYHGDDA